MGFADRNPPRRRDHQHGQLHEGLRDGCAGYMQQKKGRSGEGLKMGFKRSKVQRFNVSGSHRNSGSKGSNYPNIPAPTLSSPASRGNAGRMKEEDLNIERLNLERNLVVGK